MLTNLARLGEGFSSAFIAGGIKAGWTGENRGLAVSTTLKRLGVRGEWVGGEAAVGIEHIGGGGVKIGGVGVVEAATVVGGRSVNHASSTYDNESRYSPVVLQG